MRMPSPEFWKNKRVFITGAEGFKGKWLVKWLTRMGSIIGTNETKDIRNLPLMNCYMEFFKPEIVIHLAAISTVWEAHKNPIETTSVNALGTQTIFEICRSIPSVKAILNITTDKVYDVTNNKEIVQECREEDSLGGYEVYSASKVCSEIITKVYQTTYGLPIATARSGNVIGGGDWKYSRIVPNYFEAYKNNTVLKVKQGAVRPWQYVLDALCGYLLLAENLYESKDYATAWNFGPSDKHASVATVKWLVDSLNKHCLPSVLYDLVGDLGYYETQVLTLNSDFSHRYLDWYPKYSLDDMVEKTAQWYLSHFQGLDLTDLQLEEYIRS